MAVVYTGRQNFSSPSSQFLCSSYERTLKNKGIIYGASSLMFEILFVIRSILVQIVEHNLLLYQVPLSCSMGHGKITIHPHILEVFGTQDGVNLLAWHYEVILGSYVPEGFVLVSSVSELMGCFSNRSEAGLVCRLSSGSVAVALQDFESCSSVGAGWC